LVTCGKTGVRTSRTPAFANGLFAGQTAVSLERGTWLSESMQIGPSGGIEVRVSTRADSDANTPSAKNLTKSLNNYSLLLAPGVLGGIFAWVVYPPLDQGVLVTCGSCVLFLPMVLQLRSIFRKRLSQDVEKLRTAYVYSSIALATVAFLLVLNGRLDRSPVEVMRTTLIQKTATLSKGGTRYVLTVSSWRPGRKTEDLRVSSYEYRRSLVGKTVNVEVHKGYLGLPWSGRVSPQ